MEEDHNYRGNLFNPFLIGLLGIIAGSVMVATYHCIAFACCYNNNNNNSRRAAHDHESRQLSNNTHGQREIRRLRGTSNSTLRLIPVYRYSKDCDQGTCSVCLCEFKEGEQIRVLPECLHLFHVACIDMWLSSHTNCPNCRTEATPPQHLVLSLPDSGGVPPPEFHRLPDFGG